MTRLAALPAVIAAAVVLPSGPARAEAARSASAAARVRIAMLGLNAGEGITEKTAAMAEEMLLNALHRTRRFAVVGRSDVANLVGFERQKQIVGCKDDTSCAAEIAGSMGVPFLAAASIGRIGPFVVVSLKIIDVPRATVVSRSEVRAGGDAELPAALDRLVSDALSGCDAEDCFGAPPADRRPAAEPALGTRQESAPVQPVPTPTPAPAPQPPPEPAPARVSLTTEPPGLEVTVDGKPAGVSPVAHLEVAAGPHEAFVSDRCRSSDPLRFEAKAGEETPVSMPTKERTLSVRFSAAHRDGSEATGEALVDGRVLGPVPGTHEVPVCAGELAVAASGAKWRGPVPSGDAPEVRAVVEALRRVGDRWEIGAEAALDTRTRLAWAREIPPLPAKWEDAAAACAAMETGPWRLPTREELLGLVRLRAGDAHVDPAAFPDARAEILWSSTRAAVPDEFWGVSFGSGTPTHNGKDVPYRYRCVRGPEAP